MTDGTMPRREVDGQGGAMQSTAGGEPDPVLARAVTTLREEPQPEWEGLADRVRSRVRAATPPGRRLLARTSDLGDSAFREIDSLRVGERVVTDVVRRALLAGSVAEARDITLVVDAEDRVASVRVDLVVSYGSAVERLEVNVRSAVVAAVVDVLGPVAGGRLPVDLVVVDVLEPPG